MSSPRCHGRTDSAVSPQTFARTWAPRATAPRATELPNVLAACLLCVTSVAFPMAKAFAQSDARPIVRVSCNPRTVEGLTYAFTMRPSEGWGEVVVGFAGGRARVILDRWIGTSNRGFTAVGRSDTGNHVSFVREYDQGSAAWRYRFSHWGARADGSALDVAAGLTCAAQR